MTVREIAMLKFMDMITEKTSWNTKVFSDRVVQRWRSEVLSLSGGMISEKAFKWCTQELRDKAEDLDRDGFIKTQECASAVAKSDTIISLQFKDSLRNGVKPLLMLPNEQKDWHPYSNNQVLNQVHPSLYPLVYGRTRVLPVGQVGLFNCMSFIGQGGPAQDLKATKDGNAWSSNLWSTKFQWLPSDIKFAGESGTDVRITSYINNLHPKIHQGLYDVIERFVSKSIPLWNSVLVKSYDRIKSLRIDPCEAEVEPPKPDWFDEMWEADPVEGLVEKIRDYLA